MRNKELVADWLRKAKSNLGIAEVGVIT